MALSLRLVALPFSILLALSPACVRAANHHDRDPDLFHFKTRPELKAPRWNVTIYDRDSLSEGYWFVGIKPSLESTIGTHQGWLGPHIYDDEGELVWAGSEQFDTSNVMDFRLTNIGGHDRLTVLDRDRKSGVVLDDHYEITDSFLTDYDHDNVNGHELRFLNNGSSVLVVLNNDEDAPKEEAEAIGWYSDRPCRIAYNIFRELDSENHWKPSFEWHSLGHIELEEATETEGTLEGRCTGPWDYLHANSLDKTTDGNYLMSGRHTSTIYKISSEDGSIIWRLGGKHSDFDMGDLRFSRQHDIRFQGQNETHTVITFLDNARGQDSKDPTHDFSRGLHLALDTEKMTVTTLNTYDHPYKNRENGKYANRRGNMQLMDSGNVFMGWSELALQSEHSRNGTLLMEAVFTADFVGAYRNYKFPFVGRPLTKPDVYAVSYKQNREREHLPTTEVAVSWNGDTEVRSWKLHAKTSPEGGEETMDEFDRTGFETTHTYSGYLTSIRWEGLDKNGKVIADSGEVKTVQHLSPPPDNDFLDLPENFDGSNDDHPKKTFLGNPNVTFALLFILGLLLSAVAVLLGWLGYLPLRWLADRTRGLGKLRDAMHYKKLAGDDLDEEDGQELPYALDKTGLRSPVKPPSEAISATVSNE